MPHADATAFATGTSKSEAYAQALRSLEGLVDNVRFWPSNLANAASLLWHLFHSLPPPANQVNWAGFYVASPTDASKLLLGPFMGKVACQEIAVGRGVCGTAAEVRVTQLVPDVDAFPGHIACDGGTRSEVVVPIVVGGGDRARCVGVIDVDCLALEAFDEEDRKGLEAIARLLAETCDW